MSTSKKQRPLLPSSWRGVIFISAVCAMIAGAMFVALYPQRVEKERQNVLRIIDASIIESALEQYLLMIKRNQNE